jgi:hypothetical protein
MVFFHSSITNNDVIHVLCCTIVVSLKSQPLFRFIVDPFLFLSFMPGIIAAQTYCFIHLSSHEFHLACIVVRVRVSRMFQLTKFFSLNPVGNDFTSRQKEIEIPTRSDPDQAHNVPVVTTEIPRSGSGENGVLIMEKDENRPTSFFAQPGILAGKINKLNASEQKAQKVFLFSCRRRSRCWFIVRYLSSDVHCVPNAKEGRRLVRS